MVPTPTKSDKCLHATLSEAAARREACYASCSKRPAESPASELTLFDYSHYTTVSVRTQITGVSVLTQTREGKTAVSLWIGMLIQSTGVSVLTQTGGGQTAVWFWVSTLTLVY